MEILSNFGERLSGLMIEKEVTVFELCEIIQVDSSQLYKWLRKENCAGIKNVIKLANYFNCSIDYLIGREEFDRPTYYRECPCFFERLKFVMQDLKISGYRLCKEATISKANYFQWSKNTQPNIGHLIILADYFDCTIDYLIGRED